MWRIIMESSNFHTSSIRDERDCWKAVRRVKEGTSAVLPQFDEKWWADSTECHWFLGNVQTSWKKGKLHMKTIWRIIRKAKWYLLEQWLSIIRFQCEINQDYINLALIAGGIWKRDILIADMEHNRKLSLGINVKEVLISQKEKNSYSRQYSKIVRKRLRIPRTHSEAGTYRKERRSQCRRTSWRTGES